MRYLLALLLLAVSGSQASAAIKFCNNFEHQVQFAVAFQDQDGWVSEGWISVEPKACQTDSKHADLTEFYWRGETDWIKTKGGRTKWSWGKDRQFSVKDASFTLKNADQKLKGAHLVAFIGPVKINLPSTAVTLTIVDAKGTMTEIASETASLQSDPDYQACQNASGDEALAACDRAIGSGKFSARLLANLYLNRGVEREAKKDLDGALADYEEAIHIDATVALAYVNRADIRYKKQDYDAAIQDLDKAIELDPNYLRAYMDRADAYREKGDLSKAIEDYKKALTLNPSDEQKARIENALSNAYVDRGVDQKEQSAELADYDEALRINPNNVVGLNNRGAVYNSKGEYDKAIQDLDLAIKLKPDYARAFRNRGDAYLGKGDRERAIADYKQALSLNPSDALKKAIQQALDELESGAAPDAPKSEGATPGGAKSDAPGGAKSDAPDAGRAERGH
jgi:tetratricopeptide (TPR) repeat protein/uncharacterized membrane protein